MSNYRQIRRQTRRARKAGLQPVVVIDSPFRESAGVLLARLAAGRLAQASADRQEDTR